PHLAGRRGVHHLPHLPHCDVLLRHDPRHRRQWHPVSASESDRRPRGRAYTVAMSNPTLYERLGGVYAIAAVVDDFIDRIMDDPRLNANPKVDEAHHRVSRAGFKYLVTEMVCWATGGPQRYSGKTMYDSHAHLGITEGEWAVFLGDLEATLSKFGVP